MEEERLFELADDPLFSDHRSLHVLWRKAIVPPTLPVHVEIQTVV
jgi:hypothetical protein